MLFVLTPQISFLLIYINQARFLFFIKNIVLLSILLGLKHCTIGCESFIEAAIPITASVKTHYISSLVVTYVFTGLIII